MEKETIGFVLALLLLFCIGVVSGRAYEILKQIKQKEIKSWKEK